MENPESFDLLSHRDCKGRRGMIHSGPRLGVICPSEFEGIWGFPYSHGGSPSFHLILGFFRTNDFWIPPFVETPICCHRRMWMNIPLVLWCLHVWGRRVLTPYHISVHIYCLGTQAWHNPADLTDVLKMRHPSR